MIKSSKHGNITPIPINITGGINLQSSAISIEDNESPLMQNWHYPKGAKTPSVRPAVDCQTATALSDKIVKLFHYEKSATTAYIIGISDQNDVYYFNTANNLWTDTTIDVAKKPSCLTFNGKLLMADGSTTIKTWDGSSAGTITPGHQPGVLCEIGNRVATNDEAATGLDAVYFSKVEDETGWTATAAGGAVLLRAGYKDGSRVVGLVKNFKNELIVFKQGAKSESIYRVQTLGAPYVDSETNWVAEWVMNGQGVSNFNCADSVDTAVVFLGRYGLSALVADELYSELNMQSIGNKVNPVLGALGNTNIEVKYLSTSGQVWIIRQDTSTYIYHPHNGAFTTYYFNGEQIYSVIETTDGIFFAGEEGHLYKLTESDYRDEFTPSTYSNLNAVIKSKDFDIASGKALVKFSEFYFSPILQGTNSIYYLDNTRNQQTLVSSYTNTGTFLDDFMDATLDFMSASDYDFMGIEGTPWTQEIRKKWKGKRLQIQINTTGRCGFANGVVQVAILGG